jgi:hypothetical protein
MYAIAFYKIPVHFDALLWFPAWDDIQWSILISTVVWSFGGFDSVGSVAGNVAGGRRTFLLGVCGSFPLALINYFCPIMLDFIIDPDIKNWREGYFTHITFAAFPSPWVGIWLTIASAVSNFAQCSSGLAPVSWTVWAMSRGEETSLDYLPSILGWEWQRKENGPIVPVAAIIFTGCSILLISALPYATIIQFYLLLRITNLLFEYGSLIWLRVKEPDTPRPYKVPGGLLGVILLVTPTVIISGISIAVAKPQVLMISGGCIGGAIAIALLKDLFLFIRARYKNKYEIIDEEGLVIKQRK